MKGELNMTIEEAYNQLQERFATFETGDDWKRFLAFSARFRQYSLCNTVLIYQQRPTASFVAGFNKWKEMNRYVRKGEKGIHIFAPIIRKVPDEKDPDVSRERLTGFKLASVFDLSQTEGEEMPIPVSIKGLEDQEGADLLRERILAAVRNEVPVSFTTLPLGFHGFYDIKTGSISLSNGDSALQNVKTLFHELAHHFHETAFPGEETAEQKEFIAESAAFIACSAMGIDSSEYSIPYIKSWLDDFAAFSKMRAKIEKIASKLLSLTEEIAVAS